MLSIIINKLILREIESSPSQSDYLVKIQLDQLANLCTNLSAT